MNPYEVSGTEEWGNVLGPAMMGYSLGPTLATGLGLAAPAVAATATTAGTAATGAAAGPIGAGLGLLLGLYLNNRQKQKAAEYKKMKNETREKLVDFYKQHNERFFKTIQKKYDWNF